MVKIITASRIPRRTFPRPIHFLMFSFYLLSLRHAYHLGKFSLSGDNDDYNVVESNIRDKSLPAITHTTVEQLTSAKHAGDVERYLSAYRAAGDVKPKMVWLLSFPNSGTSYTMNLVTHMTNQSAGVNYGMEVETDVQYPVIPAYPEGPYYLNIHDHLIPSFATNKKRILIKTHCKGICINCAAKQYVIKSVDNFEDGCRDAITELWNDGRTNKEHALGVILPKQTGKILSNGGRILLHTKYPIHLIEGAVHLMRSPLDNIVSRFHNLWDGENKDFQKKFPRNQNGFVHFCQAQDGERDLSKHEIKAGIKQDVIELFVDVPCYADFYRYLQWHNLANEMIIKRDLETIRIHYKEFEAGTSNDTTGKLLKFLNIEKMHEAERADPFESNKSYNAHYTNEQKKNILKLIKHVANTDTWLMLNRYLPEFEQGFST